MNCIKTTLQLFLMTLVIVAMALIAVAVYLKYISPRLHTEYAYEFDRKELYSLSIGEPVSRVLDRIGMPINVETTPLFECNPNGLPTRQYNLTVNDILKMVTNSSCRVSLEYSRPKSNGRAFLLYYVDFRDGVVERIGNGITMD